MSLFKVQDGKTHFSIKSPISRREVGNKHRQRQNLFVRDYIAAWQKKKRAKLGTQKEDNLHSH